MMPLPCGREKTGCKTAAYDGRRTHLPHARFDPRLQPAPVAGTKQIGMHLFKQWPNTRVGAQPVAKLLGKTSPGETLYHGSPESSSSG